MQQNIGIRISATGAAQVRGELDQAAGGLDRIGTATAGLERSLGTLRGAFAGLIGAATVTQFVQAADSVTQLNNQLRLATGSVQAAQSAYNALFDIAQRSRVGFVQLGETYASITRATEGLGLSQQRLLTVTEAIGNAITISGGSAAGAQAALVQLGQGLASGALRGEELNSVMEQTPRLARALADGLGVSIGQLRQLGQEGKITADALLRALERQSEVLRREVGGSAITVGQAFTTLQNSALRGIGDLDRATGASTTLAQAIVGISGAIDAVGRTIGQHREAITAVAGALSGAAVAGGVVALAAGIARLAPAIVAVGAALAANPAVAVLLGVGVGVGALQGGLGSRLQEDWVRARLTATEEQIQDSRPARDRAQNILRDQPDSILAKATIADFEDLQRAAAGYRAELEAIDRARYGGSRRPANEGGGRLAGGLAGDAAGVPDPAGRRTGPTEAEIFAARDLRALAAYEAAEAAIEQQLRRTAEAERDLAAARSLRDVAKYEEAEAAIDRSLKSAADMVQAIEDETRALTQTNVEREVAIALRELERTGLERGSAAYEEYARRIRQAVVNRETVRESVEQTREIEAQWQRTTDNIERALTDALMQGGKSAWEYIKGLFRSEVLRPIIQAVVRPVARAASNIIGDLLGIDTRQARGEAGQQQGGASGPNPFSDFGQWVEGSARRVAQQMSGGSPVWAEVGKSIEGAASTIGKAANTLAAVGNYYQAFKAAEDGKWGEAIGTAVGQYFGGPMGAMIGNKIGSWLDKVFAGGAGTPHRGAIVRTMADGTQSLARDADWAGILNNYDQGTDQGLRTLAGVATGGFNRFASAFGAQSTAQSVISFAADGRDASIGAFQLTRDGRSLVNLGGTDFARYSSDGAQAFQAFGLDVLKQTRAALDTLDLSQWARDELAKFDEQIATLGEGNLERATDLFNSTVEGIAKLQAGMVELQRFMEPLGGVFLKVSDLSGDAMKQLVDFAGGLENLANQTQTYVQQFFNREEIAGLQAREVRDTLLGAGLTERQLRGLDTRQEFRALVESIDPSTEAGRKQLAALLGVSGTFAGLSDYFATDGGDLLSAAGQAPNTGPLTAPGAAPNAQAAESPAVAVLTNINAGIDKVVATLRELIDISKVTPRVAVSVPGGSEVTMDWNAGS